MKKEYIKPDFDVYTYAIEQGYAASIPVYETEFIGDVSLQNEIVMEGDSYESFENEEDNWF